jgi:hypothetical protein
MFPSIGKEVADLNAVKIAESVQPLNTEESGTTGVPTNSQF